MTATAAAWVQEIKAAADEADVQYRSDFELEWLFRGTTTTMSTRHPM
jgi:hypothetical protein